MNKKRLPTNTNLTLHYDTRWHRYPVQVHRGPLIADYLERINRVLCEAKAAHKRTAAFRVDLYLPATNFAAMGQPLMTRFFESLKARIGADLNRKHRAGLRVHDTCVRYIWVKETSGMRGVHFHVLLLVNRDTYHCVGNYEAEEGNMAARIKRAWASALGIDIEAIQSRGLVHFPQNGTYKLDGNSPEQNWQFEELFYRVSYFAKADTKPYCNGSHHFGCSRR